MNKPLPVGWCRVRLGEVLEQVNRFEQVKPGCAYRLLGVKWYANGCHLHTEILGHALKTKILSTVRADDITYNKMWTSKGAFGVVQPEQDGFVATSEYPLFTSRDSALSPAFLSYVFRQRKFWVAARALCKGTTQRARLNPSDFLRLEIDLPPRSEQECIIAVLRAVDEAIKANEEVIACMHDLKKALAHELLTRGLPGRHTHFKDSPIGRIPQDWKVSAVGEVGKVQLGRQRSPAHRTGKFTKPYLRVANVFDGYIDYSNILEMDFDQRDFETYCLYPGDILLNEGQSRELVGRSSIFNGPPRTYCFQNTLIRFRAHDYVIPEFAQAYFQHCLYIGTFARISRQTTSIAHLGTDRFSKLSFPLPDANEQWEIARVLNACGQSVERQTEALTELMNTRTILTGYLLLDHRRYL